MEYDEFLREAHRIYEEYVESQDDADFIADDGQMDVFIEAYRKMEGIVKVCGGEIEPFKIEPRKENGGITAYLSVFYLSGHELEKFRSVIDSVSAVSIDSLTDGTICVSLTIPGVFKRRH